MKNILLLVLITFLMGCSLSPEERMKKLVNKYLNEDARGWDNFEIGKYGHIDSSFTSIEDNADYIYMAEMRDSMLNEAQKYLNRAKQYIVESAMGNEAAEEAYNLLHSRALDYKDQGAEYNKKVIEILNNNKRKFQGWRLPVKFYQISGEKKKMRLFIFHFDNDFREIIKVDDEKRMQIRDENFLLDT